MVAVLSIELRKRITNLGKLDYLVDFAARLATKKHAKTRSERPSCTDFVLAVGYRVAYENLTARTVLLGPSSMSPHRCRRGPGLLSK
jgi:hypothetical protein